jgi:prepilin-type N-terminal cleavage/methylation domain-containing protein
MKLRRPPLPVPSGARGFSLIELLVSVSLLSVIVLALYAMFDQTQKALRSAAGQVDVMEGSRAALNLMIRDIEEAQPAGVVNGPHFATRVSARANLIADQTLLFQERQPVLQEVFGIKSVGDHRWQVFGYFIANEDTPSTAVTPPIGTLYRYEDRAYYGRLSNVEFRTSTSNTPIQFITRGSSAAGVLQRNVILVPGVGLREGVAYRTNSARVLDGVLNFRITPYDEIGRPVDASYPLDAFPPPNGGQVFPPLLRNNVMGGLVSEITYAGTAMPAFVELEIDVLEPRLLEQYRALPQNPAIRNRYLTNNLSRVQSFRQRIPLRSTYR